MYLSRPSDRSARPGGLLLLVATATLVSLAACERRDGVRCHLVENEDGSSTMRCSDGSEALLRRHRPPVVRATLVGSARLFGEDRHEGIEVLLQPNDNAPALRTVTDVEGAYAFEDVPAGVYSLSFRHPGYVDQVLTQQILLPEGRALEPVVLRSGVRIHGGTCARLVVAPTEDAFLCLRHGLGELLLWEEGGEFVTLSEQAGQPAFGGNGDLVLFLDEFQGETESGTLTIHDRRDGQRRKVAEQAQSWVIAPGGGSLVVRQTGDRLAVWTWRLSSTVIAERASAWRYSPDGRLVLLFARTEEEAPAQLILWDVEARAGSSLGPARAPLPAFAPDERSFLYRSAAGDAFYWDGERAASLHLGGDLLETRLSPDGAFIFLRDERRALWLHEIRTGARRKIADAVDWADFDPLGEGLFYVRAHSAQGRALVRHDLAGGTYEAVAAAPYLETPLFPPTGGSAWFRLGAEGEGAWSLWAWTRERGSEEVAADSKGPPRFSPDGRAATFVAGEGFHLHLWDLEAWEGTVLAEGVAATGPVGWFGGSRRLFFLDGPLAFPGLGPLAIWEREAARKSELGPDFAFETCRFGRDGALLCLARPSLHEGPRGAELIRWEPEGGGLHRIGDGVGSFGSIRSGKRTLFLSQPRLHTEPGLLWLYDASLGRAVPLDDRVGAAVAGPRWVAYSVEAPEERRGLYLSTYPAAPTLPTEDDDAD